ncbi:YncE family protein [Flavobacterium sp.]|uniref:YncE family protein n=1 Tax=Flavobacterium sp. TaxID=239 RepID=UPI003C6A5915
MKATKHFLSILLLTFLFASCTKENVPEINVPLGAYDNGILILNEGNFGTPNASVSYISNDFMTFQNSIFLSVNPTKELGDVAQSMSFDKDKAYIVLNNSNKIEVVNRYTFVSLGTITEKLENPRYSLVLNGKLYVTNAISNAITVYDATTYDYIASIPLNKTAEKIVAANGKLYVMNGAYGYGNRVTVVSPVTNTVLSTIDVEEGINSIEEQNGVVYVLCGNTTKSKLFKINTTTDAITFIESTTLKGALNMDIEANKIYYTAGTSVYVMDLVATSFNETPLFSVTDNSWSTLYGFGVIKDQIYTADASGFTADGVVTVYSSAGVILKTVSVGLGPNSFYANNLK